MKKIKNKKINSKTKKYVFSKKRASKLMELFLRIVSKETSNL